MGGLFGKRVLVIKRTMKRIQTADSNIAVSFDSIKAPSGLET